jgi:hypothetical protein
MMASSAAVQVERVVLRARLFAMTLARGAVIAAQQAQCPDKHSLPFFVTGNLLAGPYQMYEYL